MEKIYCIFCNKKDTFDVFQLNIKAELKGMYTIEYHPCLAKGHINHSDIDKIIRLSNGRGTVAFTKNEKLISYFLDILAKQELIFIKSEVKRLSEYKNAIQRMKEHYL
ncbi:hypothetical protein [Macrococcoides canis]|uniref:hypothetical protein n=1 Tax=Macrococcoides canis TaxID=1855823 RepID=UPI0022B88DA7|nr:hypothetical protein [Macrococcus canis]WBF54018.1 hypothetical protein LL975_11995 [Macrococcus canis]